MELVSVAYQCFFLKKSSQTITYRQANIVQKLASLRVDSSRKSESRYDKVVNSPKANKEMAFHYDMLVESMIGTFTLREGFLPHVHQLSAALAAAQFL